MTRLVEIWPEVLPRLKFGQKYYLGRNWIRGYLSDEIRPDSGQSHYQIVAFIYSSLSTIKVKILLLVKKHPLDPPDRPSTDVAVFPFTF